MLKCSAFTLFLNKSIVSRNQKKPKGVKMIRSALFCMTALLLLAGFSTNKCESVQWQTNFEEAMNAARVQNKPVVLFFTGSDWCVWCKKLEAEALNTREFEQAASQNFVFLELDFPQKGQQNPTVAAQNRDLEKRFGVKGFPTIVVLDSNGQKLGSTGYKPGGGRAYADHLLQMVQDNSAFKARTTLQ